MSRNLCCVNDCNNTKYEKPKLSFHNFPTKEPERLKKWVEFCENELLTQLYETCDPKLEHKSICSEHFEDNKYNNPMKKIRLMCNALPTLKGSQNSRTTFTVVEQNTQPVQVIPAQLLLRTDLSRGWRQNRVNQNQDQNDGSNESLESTKVSQIESQSRQTQPEVQNRTQTLKANPILKHFSVEHIRYQNEVKILKEKLRKSKKQVMNLRYRLKRTNPIGNTRKSKLNYIIKCVKSLSEESLNAVMSEIIECHLSSAFLNRPRVQKWTNRMKKFCADLYHKSPTAYSFLQKTITLPTKKTVLKFTEDRIQNIKNKTFNPTTSCDNNIEIDTNVNEMIAKFTENPVICLEPIDDLLVSNDLNNISLEFNCSERSNDVLIADNVIELEAMTDERQSDRPLTTQITLIDKFNTEIKTYKRAKE